MFRISNLHPSQIIVKHAFFFFATTFVLGTAVTAAPKVKFTQVYPNLDTKLPVSLVVPPDGTDRQFLVLQGGKILLLPKDNNASEAKVFYDISDRDIIAHKFEEGLLGLAFHPKFKENKKLYVYHSMQSPKRSVIAEYKADGDKVDMSTERILLEVPQPYWNHNSGNLLFGPDGYLYIAFGDGGKRDDPLKLAQNPFVLNGKIIRIDVDSKCGQLEYGIPEDNPFVGKNKDGSVNLFPEGRRAEIWALGLRNPWGISFDEQGRFWCADVGQDLWEEINLIEKGGNYGWSFREGARDFPLNKIPKPKNLQCVEPIHEYTRNDGTSITGGLVYRGSKIPALKGYYVYGDWGLSNIWALKCSGGEKEDNVVLFHDPKMAKAKPNKAYKPAAFCEGPDKEIYLLAWGGQIYRIDPAD